MHRKKNPESFNQLLSEEKLFPFLLVEKFGTFYFSNPLHHIRLFTDEESVNLRLQQHDETSQPFFQTHVTENSLGV